MKIIISSSRTMKEEPVEGLKLPQLIDKTGELLEILQEKDEESFVKLTGLTYKNADLAYREMQKLDLYHHLSPAVKTYKGVVYKQFADLLEDRTNLAYLQKHLCIISAFYGILEPLDGIRAYRLEMKDRLETNKGDLYRFWSYLLYEKVRSDVIVNLASEEYGRCIRSYLNADDFFLDIDFLEKKDGRLKRVSTQMKKARGLMIRYMLNEKVENINQLKKFTLDGYRFDEPESSEKRYCFVKES